jgi:hypothetical protein
MSAEIMKELASVQKKLDFMVSLQADEVSSLFKAGNIYAPFIEKAYNAVCEHPEIMPGIFDIEEFKRDYRLSKSIIPILNKVNEIAEGLSKTNIAVNSDSMAESLEVYSAVKQNKDRIPGLKVVADEMSGFFKRPRKNTK